MSKRIFTIEEIKELILPIVRKYEVNEVYLFGSYARGEADENSDLDFLVYGGENFKLKLILALAEEVREVLDKDVDMYEIHEIKQDSDFYRAIMKDKLVVV